MDRPPLKLLDRVRVRIRLKGYSQAFNAILFLYNQVLNTEMPDDINTL